jgi:hypothetical protein
VTSGQVLGGTSTPLPPGLSKQAARVYRTLAQVGEALRGGAHPAERTQRAVLHGHLVGA